MKTTMTNRVLLVDDEPALLSALRRAIEKTLPDSVVVFAGEAKTAVWQIETTSICLVVTDMRMQGDSQAGWTVVRAAQSAGIPVIVISGMTETAELESVAHEAIPMIEKRNFSPEKLAALIVTALAAARAA
ncbi:MAG: hypothetical protein NVS3B20_20100 [Polyangiales bacterium]